MILFSEADLLEATEDIIVHQVNCQGKMNSGIARQIREKWPTAYDAYMAYCDFNAEPKNMLGSVRIIQVEPHKFVAHLFGQEHYGYDGRRYTSYDALYEGLTYIKSAAQQYGKSVALPFKIGCERGGADWRIVSMMIEQIFADYKVHLYKLEEK